jgi:hypothetical protein
MALVKGVADNTTNFIGNVDHSCPGIYTDARFVLAHLRNSQEALEKMWRAIRPGCIVVLQDSDFRGCFCHPECTVFSRYVQLYTQTTQRRAVDPNIGPQLAGLLAKAGFEKIEINVVQNAAMSGEVKLMAPLTMENIADAVLVAGLASRAELDRLVHELYEFARDPDTVIGGPRVADLGPPPAARDLTGSQPSTSRNGTSERPFANILSASAHQRPAR